MLTMRMMIGAVLAAVASVASCLAVGAEPSVIMTATAAIAGANLVEGIRLLDAWGGRWYVVAWETTAAVSILRWITVEVLLLALMILLACALAWLRRTLDREE